jgi:AcrR family transcriptional regulator
LHKKSRGRPKVFDREAALDKAMTLFWQHGYEATSLADLVEATGAKAPTLYAEFVNKEGLFRAVLDRYISRFAAKHEACCLPKENPSIRRCGTTSPPSPPALPAKTRRQAAL